MNTLEKNVLSSLDEDVRRALGEEIRKKIIASRVSKELDSLSDIIEKGMDLRHSLVSGLKEIRGAEQFDANGAKVLETFSRQQSQQKKELQEDIKILDEALSCALCEFKYDKLTEYLDKKSSKPKSVVVATVS